MTSERIVVGVVAERRRASSPWAEHVWSPLAVLPGAPEVPPWTRLGGDAERMQYFLGTVEVELHRTETQNYKDNLGSGRPSLWVVLRPLAGEPPVELVAVTADPAEGEAFTEPGTDIVEMLAMPGELVARVEAFVILHHVERAFLKRRRDRADPEALAHRAPRDDTPEGEA